MSPALEHIKKEISTLPVAERFSLWRDLGHEFEPTAAEDEDEPAVEAAWDQEIAGRVKEIEQGTVQLVSAEEVERNIAAHMAKLGLVRKARPA